MRILADENVERLVIERLRADAHAVEAIAEVFPGADDALVLAHSVQENALLLTADRDFGDQIFRDGLTAPAAGVVLYRLGATLKEPERAEVIGRSFVQHAAAFAGHFTVIEHNKLRFRPLP